MFMFQVSSLPVLSTPAFHLSSGDRTGSMSHPLENIKFRIRCVWFTAAWKNMDSSRKAIIVLAMLKDRKL